MIFIRWILAAISVMLVTVIVPGISVKNFWIALIVALVLGFLNAIIRPILIFLTLPATILTLGLFVLIINAVIFLIASMLIPGFEVTSFGAAFIGALVLSAFGWIINVLTNQK